MRVPRSARALVTAAVLVGSAAACADEMAVADPFALDRDAGGRIAVVDGHVTARLCDAVHAQTLNLAATTLGPDDGTPVAATDGRLEGTSPTCFVGCFPEQALGPRDAAGGERVLVLTVALGENTVMSRAIFDIPPVTQPAPPPPAGGGHPVAGAAWSLLSAAEPPERHGAAGAGFAGAGPDEAVIFGGIRADRETCIYRSGSWAGCLVDATGPAARRAAGMAAHAAGGQHLLVLFGGDDGTTFYGDTWLWDGSGTWTADATVAAPPPARSHHAMATLGDGRVLLFGGLLDPGPPLALTDDTWIYDAATGWQQVAPTGSSPTARYMHAMAPLPDGRVLLHGGYDAGASTLADAWIFDPAGPSWTPIADAGAGQVAGALLAPAEEGGQPVLFGGEGPGGPRDSLWVWNGSAFTPLAASGTAPTHRTAVVGFTFVGAAGADHLVVGPGFSAPPPTFVPVPADGSFQLEHDA